MRQSISAAALAATVVSAWDIATPLPSNPSWQPTPSPQTLWNPANGAPIVVQPSAAIPSTPPTSMPVPGMATSIPVIPGMATSTVSVWATVDLTVTACSLPAGACSAPPTPELPSTPPSLSSWAPPGAPPGAPSWMPSATAPSWQPSWSNLPAGCLPTSPLTNQQQVGDSILGTLCQPYLPQWLPDALGKRQLTPPWGDATNQNADAVNAADIPNTGVTRKYNFDVTRGEISPDGAIRQVMMVNNQFPGPMIEANWGGMFLSKNLALIHFTQQRLTFSRLDRSDCDQQHRVPIRRYINPLARLPPTRNKLGRWRAFCGSMSYCTLQHPHLQIPGTTIRVFMVARTLLSAVHRWCRGTNRDPRSDPTPI